MKKLLYTLFAFAIIVACEKDAFDLDEVNVDSINAVVESDNGVDFLEVLANLSPEDRDYQAPKASKGSPSTARTTDGTCGEGRDLTANIITVTYFYTGVDAATGPNYVLARDERSTPVMIDPAKVTAETTYTKTNATTVGVYNNIRRRSFGNIQNPRQNLLDLFENPYNVVYTTRPDRSLISLQRGARRANLNIDCTPTTAATVYEYGTQIIGGANDGRVIIPLDPLDMDAASNPTAAAVGTANLQFQLVRRVAGSGVNTWEAVGDPFTNPNYVAPPATRWTMTMVEGVMTFDRPDMGTYTLTPAPFPLTGLLGTVTREADGVTGTLNYAGTGSIGDPTTHAGVRNAIETSFAN